MARTTPRVTQYQLKHYLRKLVNFNDTGIAAGVIMGTIPSGSLITNVEISVTTAFNAATTNNLLLGSSGADNTYVQTADAAAGTLGAKNVTRAFALGPVATDIDVYVSYTQTGTAATAGVAYIVVNYVPNNDL